MRSPQLPLVLSGAIFAIASPQRTEVPLFVPGAGELKGFLISPEVAAFQGSSTVAAAPRLQTRLDRA